MKNQINVHTVGILNIMITESITVDTLHNIAVKYVLRHNDSWDTAAMFFTILCQQEILQGMWQNINFFLFLGCCQSCRNTFFFNK